MASKKDFYRFLALGDSYTIGESVPIAESFPYQTTVLLRREGLPVLAPEIIARTGWTSFELEGALSDSTLLPPYDLVTLLVGVNNQYRGLNVNAYLKDFESLLSRSVQLAGDQPNQVFVLSIPDWGMTPYAENRDRKMIHSQIDNFNKVNFEIAQKIGVRYLDITHHSRNEGADPSMFAPDGLHPSGKTYHYWASMLAKEIIKSIREL